MKNNYNKANFCHIVWVLGYSKTIFFIFNGVTQNGINLQSPLA